MNRLYVLGINHKSAPLARREKVSLSEDGLRRILASSRTFASEAVVISTCNRTELYLAERHAHATREFLVRELVCQEGDENIADWTSCFYEHEGRNAVGHLLALCAGLDSMVVGEVEILGQVKRAYALAQELGTTGKATNALFQYAFRVAKRAHSQTNLGRGRVSVSSIAVEFAGKVFDDLSDKTVMILGAGETAEGTLRSLIGHGVREVLILNRSLDRAEDLAKRFGGKACQLDLLEDLLPRTEIVIASTAASSTIVSRGMLAGAMRERHRRPMLLIDISVPRDIDPSAHDLPDVYLYHIDDLQRVADANRAQREGEVEHVRSILQEEMNGLSEIFASPALSSLLGEFDRHAENIAENALARSLSKEKMSSLPDDVHDEVRALVKSVTRKLLANPRDVLKKASHNGKWDDYSRVTQDLFGFPDADTLEQNGPDDDREVHGPGSS